MANLAKQLEPQVLDCIRRGSTRSMEILRYVGYPVSLRTIQRVLKNLVDAGRLTAYEVRTGRLSHDEYRITNE
jgi:DNA-binding HxlR family transcriptional regulator